MDRLIDRIDTQAGAAHTLALCGDVQARFLADTALESLTTLDSQWHARPLGHIIATAELTSDQVTADRALALARYDLDEAKDPRPLAEAAQQVAGTGRPARLEQIVGRVDVSADPELAQDLCGPLITAYLHAGDVEQSLRIWRTLLGADQLGQMRTLTRTLNRGVHTLAAPLTADTHLPRCTGQCPKHAAGGVTRRNVADAADPAFSYCHSSARFAFQHGQVKITGKRWCVARVPLGGSEGPPPRGAAPPYPPVRKEAAHERHGHIT